MAHDWGSVHDCLTYVQKLRLEAKEAEAAQLLVNREEKRGIQEGIRVDASSRTQPQ